MSCNCYRLSFILFQQCLKGLNHSLLYLLQTLAFGQSVRKILPLPFAVSVKIFHPTPDLAFSEIFFQKNRQIQQFCKRSDRFLCSWIGTGYNHINRLMVQKGSHLFAVFPALLCQRRIFRVCMNIAVIGLCVPNQINGSHPVSSLITVLLRKLPLDKH